MRCMKTGLRFSVPEFNDETYHGDMFYNAEADVAIICGIAKGTSNMIPQIILEKFGDVYYGTPISELEIMIKKYFPNVDIRTLQIIVVDTRFF